MEAIPPMAPPSIRIRSYWIQFNPKTRRGAFWLDFQGSSEPDVTKNDLTPEDVAAVTAILTTGRAVFFQDGSLGVEG
jgi:hypothetical protein